MKKQMLVSIVFIFFLFSPGINQAQEEVYPTHLFLGYWTFATQEDTTVDNWIHTGEGHYTGMTTYTDKNGTILAETMRLAYIDGKLFYCATIAEQNPDDPEGEICFGLKSYKDRKFVFENLKHDYPQRIIYDFSNYRICKARIENETKSFDFDYKKEDNSYTSFDYNGKFVKEPFVNKAGKIIKDVYDYFFVIEGIKYFVKFSESDIKRADADKFLDTEVTAGVIFKDGLWDADDNTHQSRIGQYVSITGIGK